MSSFVKLGRIRFFYVPSNMCHLAVQQALTAAYHTGWMYLLETPINTIQKKTHLYVSNVTQISELRLLIKL